MKTGWVCAVVFGGALAGAADVRAQAADEDRGRALTSELRADPLLRDDAVRAEVGGGKVLLAGEVDSQRERERAVEVVRKADPTLQVQNFLAVEEKGKARESERPAYVDTNLDDKAARTAEKAAEKATNAAREAGDVMSDGWITSKVKSKLVADDTVDASGIDVDTQNRVVTVRGQVRSEVERAKVVQHARSTKGVNVVIDEMKVAPSPVPARNGTTATPPEGTQRR